jgi:predicted RNA-binding Zn-ribbon protein involved in translation (DUF1610 family)
MKNAFYQIEAVSFVCPNCDEIISEEGTGSQMFTVDDLEMRKEELLTCPSCGVKCRIPKSLTKQYTQLRK